MDSRLESLKAVKSKKKRGKTSQGLAWPSKRATIEVAQGSLSPVDEVVRQTTIPEVKKILPISRPPSSHVLANKAPGNEAPRVPPVNTEVIEILAKDFEARRQSDINPNEGEWGVTLASLK